jgi:hypothetical protein
MTFSAEMNESQNTRSSVINFELPCSYNVLFGTVPYSHIIKNINLICAGILSEENSTMG